MDRLEVQQTVDQEKDLTTIRLAGRVRVDEFIRILEGFYEHGFTKNLLWDFSRADISSAERQELEKILSVAKRYAHLRPDGKTAILAPKTLDYGVGRMYEVLAEHGEHPVSHAVFTGMWRAAEWLERGD
jgi:hypothetical protein